MQHRSFTLSDKLSVSLCSMLDRVKKKELPRYTTLTAGYVGDITTPTVSNDLVDVNLEIPDFATAQLPDLRNDESLDNLSGTYYSGRLRLGTLKKLAALEAIERIATKKQKQLLLDEALKDIGLLTSGTPPRTAPETGVGVFIGIVDSGFDLSHPMFRDGTGKLRVKALLDQTRPGNLEFDTTALENALASGDSSVRDENGHGTHVASIAGGSPFQGFEGVAPEVQFLLVKTDFINVDSGVAWIFRQAGTNPCVVNLSLGSHYGPHDGTSQEEKLYEQLVGPGKILIVAAGNERQDNLHIGGRFVPGQVEEVAFDILPERNGQRPPISVATFWYEDADSFDVELITPSRQSILIPAINKTDRFTAANLEIEVSRRRYTPATAIQIEVTINFTRLNIRSTDLRNWRFRFRCTSATVGRLDGWFANQGFGRFRSHPLLETARTLGIPATSNASITVASHVTKNTWDSDDGQQLDGNVLIIGRSSPFSSLGPTRDGRWKPDISAPGQYLMAALSSNSELSTLPERALVGQKLVTIEGTSMATPVVAGAIALMLQKKPSLTPSQILDLFNQNAQRDRQTGPALWTPTYGYGKLDIPALLSKV
jgi:subtilisin family serine protease